MSEETQQQEKTQMVTFLDTVGRIYLAELIPEKTNESILGVRNPVVLVTSDDPSKMSVRLVPPIFREFLADKTQDLEFDMKKDLIHLTNITDFDFRLHSQYDQMFNKNNVFVPPQAPPPQAPDAKEEKVVNLFDE